MGQKIIDQFQGSGVIGTFVDTFPKTIKSFTLSTTLPENNVIGRGFSFNLGASPTLGGGSVAAGGAAATNPFAGYLVDPYAYASVGTTGEPLAPSLVLPNGTSGQIMFSGRFYAYLEQSFDPGYLIYVSETDGTLLAQAPGGTTPAGYREGFAQIAYFANTFTTSTNGPNAIIEVSADVARY